MTDEQYYTLIHPYQDAMNLILTRLKILNHTTYESEDFQPIHSITNRIKEKGSIENKLRKKHASTSVQDAKALLQDIAGVRVICFFEKDIRHLVECLRKQSDLIVIKEKDYISTPKPNGYRSYHMIVEVPVFFYGGNVPRQTVGTPYDMTDLAPTLTALLGIPTPNACTSTRTCAASSRHWEYVRSSVTRCRKDSGSLKFTYSLITRNIYQAFR